MNDQAEKLRQLMNNTKVENSTSNKKAKVISISSGKGGVGKTNFAINFSISLKKLGYDVAIIDADIGLSNIEILSGTHMKYSISDIIFSNKNIFEIIENGPEGVKIISGGSGFKELKLFEEKNFNKLISEIEKLQSSVDYIIIDTGAGISSTVIDFIMTSEEVIIICTPDPTSIMDSYTLIKSVISSNFEGKVNLISNQVVSRKEGKEIFDKLYNTIKNFLKVEISYLGYIEKSNIVINAVKKQVPFVISHPNNSISKRINIMAMNYMEENPLKSDSKISFAKKIFDIFSRKDD